MSDEKLVMPARQPTDGPVSVNRPAEGELAISVETGGEIHTIRMSEYNAWRVFGMMSIMLGIPLGAEARKAIKLGDDLEATFRPETAGRELTLGDRVAWNLANRMLAEHGLAAAVDVVIEGDP